MSAEDEELMLEINRLAQSATESKNEMMDLEALSITLAGRFQHTTAKEIKVSLTRAWRERSLAWVN